MERLAKMLLIEPEARRRVQMRASRYLQTYPHLLKRGVAALVVIPIVLLALMCILHRTFDLLMLWVCSLTVISPTSSPWNTCATARSASSCSPS